MADPIRHGTGGLDGRCFDVAVVGGGLAGVAAAWTAAACGARTLLVEETPALGGNATGAFVHTFCGLYALDAGDAPRPANPGFAVRFAEGLAAAGGAGRPERAGRVWVLPTDPPAIEAHATHLCATSERLETRLACRLFGARLSLAHDGTSRLAFESDGRRAEVQAELVIDTSGDAALGAIGGAETERAGPDEIQLPSYIARLSGVPAADVEGFGRLRLAVAVAGAARREDLPTGCESVLLRPASVAGEAYLTLNVSREALRAAASGDPERTRHGLEIRARGDVESIVAHLRRTRSGYEDCRVAAWPRRLGVREGDRLAGLSRLDAEAVLSGSRREDEVAVSTWPIELWHDHRGATLRHPEGPSSIPLGALVSRSHPRLGMAGRCLSASHEALGALRVLGTAMATGEAIGIAAALAAERRGALAEIKADEVRLSRATPAP